MRYSIIAICIICILFSCSKDQVNSISEFTEWINNEENNLIKTKVIGDVEYKVRIVPAEYFLYKELHGRKDEVNQIVKDSILTLYSNNLTVIVSFNQAEIENGDVIFNNISNYSEYKERFMILSFKSGELFKIKHKSKEISPILFHFENTYGLREGRDLILVFPISNDLFKDDDQLIELIYNDEVFGNGFLHFDFQLKYLKQLPSINIK